MSGAEPARGGGLRWILLATALAGGLGYVLQLAAPAVLSATDYVAFSVMWSTIYLCVSAMSGVQQEVTRASRRSDDHVPNTVLRRFTIVAGVVVILASVVLGVALSAGAVPVHGAVLAAVLATGLVGYLLTAVLSGVLYGLHLWRAVALVTVLDAVFRALLLGLGFVLQLPATLLLCGIAFPFGLAFLTTWLVVRRRVIGRFALDVGFAPLSRNVVSTVTSAACSGAMISGLPLLLGLTSAHEPAAALGAVILAITLSRAPIVVPILALQSYLISAVFRDRQSVRPRRLFALLGIAVAVMTVLSAIAALVGPPIVSFVSGGRYTIAPLLMAAIVFSAGLVAMMCVTGPALVSARAHTANTVGWVIAAGLTVLCLVLPFDLHTRVAAALIAPAMVGLVVHVASLLRPRASVQRASGPDAAPQ